MKLFCLFLRDCNSDLIGLKDVVGLKESAK